LSSNLSEKEQKVGQIADPFLHRQHQKPQLEEGEGEKQVDERRQAHFTARWWSESAVGNQAQSPWRG